jgi:hypothetical protein
MGTWLQRLLINILTLATPEIVTELRMFAKEFREKAKSTPNPWDDAAANLLCFILGVND